MIKCKQTWLLKTTSAKRVDDNLELMSIKIILGGRVSNEQNRKTGELVLIVLFSFNMMAEKNPVRCIFKNII